MLSLPILSAPASDRIADFALSDQHSEVRTYHFPRRKLTFMTVADNKGSAQLAAWIEPIYQRYGKKIDIDGLADVSMIPRPLHGFFRAAFRRELAHSVLLDWQGDVIKQFPYEKNVANIYLLDVHGVILQKISGPYQPALAEKLFQTIDAQL